MGALNYPAGSRTRSPRRAQTRPRLINLTPQQQTTERCQLKKHGKNNMQAIITKYIAPTNTRCTRVKAECERGKITISWNAALDVGGNHRAACDALCARFDAEDVTKYGQPLKKSRWSSPKASGQIPDGRYVFCFIPERVLTRNY